MLIFPQALKIQVFVLSVIVRFAPSPTGKLHLGNARVAVINWLFARKLGGKFMFRVDDTDASRVKPEYLESLYTDLEWLGLDYDIFAKQSERLARYEEIKCRLIESDLLYPCYETPEELDVKRRQQIFQKKPPIYDRSALTYTKEEINKWEKNGRRPHWRFKLRDGEVSWQDLTKGPLLFNPRQSLSDPILVKEDGTFLYTLTSVVDDFDFNISHIIRGEDHVTNTAIQIQLFEALGKNDINFAHLALLSDAAGEPLSKRMNSFSLQNLRTEGIEPMAIVCFLASLGGTSAPHITHQLDDLISSFDISAIHGGARLDEKAILSVNHKILHTFPFPLLQQKHPKTAKNFTEKEWKVIREAIGKMDDVPLWENVLHGKFSMIEKLSADDTQLLLLTSEFLSKIEGLNFGEDVWDELVTFLKEKTGVSGHRLIRPIRFAITGQEHGPEMKRLLHIMAKDTILQRINV